MVLGNLLKCHGEVLYLQPVIPPKRFDIFSPWLGDAQKVQVRSDFSLNTKHMPEKDRRRALDRDFGIVPAARHLIPSPDRNHAPKRIASTTPLLSGFQVSLSAKSTSLRESLSWSSQRGSKMSQVCFRLPYST